jgi:alkane 1-monooxygenase
VVSLSQPSNEQTNRAVVASPARFPLRHTGFLAAYTMTASVFIANHTGGVIPFLTPVIAFMLIPIFDVIAGADEWNAAPEDEPVLENKLVYRLLLWTWAPVQVALILYSAWGFSTQGRGPVLLISSVLASGITAGGFGITIAHELGHRSNPMDRWAARILLACVCYLHFTVEHNRGHHIHVATPRDPATARFGESFWRFFLRTVPQQYASAWRLENERVRKRHGRALHPRNRMIAFSFVPPAIASALYLWLGPMGVLFFFAQSVVAFGLLEVVNYIEHYGLRRRETEPGVYERVQPHHSWNASFLFSNWLLFGLQRHADHHANAGRRYQILRHIPGGPQLPAGYPTMIPIPLVPPLWRAIMDKRAIEARRAAGTWHDDTAGD